VIEIKCDVVVKRIVDAKKCNYETMRFASVIPAHSQRASEGSNDLRFVLNGLARWDVLVDECNID
jgi:hypothetical protein